LTDVKIAQISVNKNTRMKLKKKQNIMEEWKKRG
jgi:hypothetical protein